MPRDRVANYKNINPHIISTHLGGGQPVVPYSLRSSYLSIHSRRHFGGAPWWPLHLGRVPVGPARHTPSASQPANPCRCWLPPILASLYLPILPRALGGTSDHYCSPKTSPATRAPWPILDSRLGHPSRRCKTTVTTFSLGAANPFSLRAIFSGTAPWRPVPLPLEQKNRPTPE